MVNEAGEQSKPKGLIIKLCQIMAITGYVEKSGINQKQGYKYVTEADVLAMLRKELASRHIFVFPSVESTTRAFLYKTQGGADMHVTDVMVKWTFLDGETGEVHECYMPGCGTDTGDKGLYKAITGASKYMFLKMFMLPTGDDPEDENVDKEEGKAAAKEVADKFLEAHKAKATASVHTKIVEFYPQKLGDLDVLAFVPSDAFALMLDNGANEFTIYADSSKFRYMLDDAGEIRKLSDIATKLGITLKRIENYGAPITAKSPMAPVPAVIPYTGPKPSNGTMDIVSCKIVNARGKQFLSVMWGNQDYSVWDAGMWPPIQGSIGYPAMFEFTTKQVGAKTYHNITGIKRIGTREYEENMPIRNVNDFGETPWH